MAANRNISIYSGDTYVHEVRLQTSSNTAINISTRLFSGQLRVAPSSTEIIANFSANITDGANGIVLFSMTSAVTSNIVPGTYYYDFQQIDGVITTTLLAGRATVQEDVTYVS